MKRKDAYEVEDDFFDLTLSSPALKIRRLMNNSTKRRMKLITNSSNESYLKRNFNSLDAELAPIIDQHETLNSVEFQQSIPIKDNHVDQSMESSPISIDELKNSVPVNDERAIVLFNPNNNTHLLQSPISYSIPTDSNFLSRFKNPVIWLNRSDTRQSLADETQNQDDDSGMINGCLAVVPWVPQTAEHEASVVQTSDMMDSDAMDVEDDNNNNLQIPKHDDHVTTSVPQVWNQVQQHCMIQQPHNKLSTPITWLG